MCDITPSIALLGEVMLKTKEAQLTGRGRASHVQPLRGGREGGSRLGGMPRSICKNCRRGHGVPLMNGEIKCKRCGQAQASSATIFVPRHARMQRLRAVTGSQKEIENSLRVAVAIIPVARAP